MDETKQYSEITIAIFPFENLTEHKGMDVFCKSFYIDLVTELSRFRQFRIVAYESLITSSDMSTAYSIRGSFMSMSDTVKINAQLIDNQRNRVAWAERYEGNRDSIFSIQEDLLKQVVSTLQLQLNYDLLIHIRKKHPVALSAYEHWLYGMEELKKGSLESDEKARTHFQHAIDIDPHYSLAYSGMSLTYFNEWSCQLWERWDVCQQGAFVWAKKAIELDEQNYMAALVLGRVYLYEGEYELAEHYLRKAIQLNSSDAESLIQAASCFVFLGYLEEAKELYHKVLHLDSLHANHYRHIGAFIAFEQGHFEKCITLSAGFDSPWIDSTAILAAAYYETDDEENMRISWVGFLREFQKKIAKSKDVPGNDVAVQWLINVSPFKINPRLRRFWEYIGGEKILSSSNGAIRGTPQYSKNFFLKEDDWWQLSFEGKTVRLADAKGLHDLAKLLGKPGNAFHCTELMSGGVHSRPEYTFDEKAKQSYQKKILELQEEIKLSEGNNDSQRSAMLHQEYDQIVDHLTTSLGLGGRSRKLNDPLDKVRSAVTWRIRSAIKKIEKIHPTLGKHFAASIKTGLFCSYHPEKEVLWILS